MSNVTQLFRPSQLWGLGDNLAVRRPDGVFSEAAAGALGMQYDVGTGVFRYPWDGGGGVFNAAISGATGQISETKKVAYFLGAVALAGVATYWGLKKLK